MVRLRQVAPDLVDLWVEVGQASIGPFQVRYPDDRDDLTDLARAVINGSVTLRIAPWGGGGTVTWSGARWSTGPFANLIARRVIPRQYPAG